MILIEIYLINFIIDKYTKIFPSVRSVVFWALKSPSICKTRAYVPLRLLCIRVLPILEWIADCAGRNSPLQEILTGYNKENNEYTLSGRPQGVP